MFQALLVFLRLTLNKCDYQGLCVFGTNCQFSSSRGRILELLIIFYNAHMNDDDLIQVFYVQIRSSIDPCRIVFIMHKSLCNKTDAKCLNVLGKRERAMLFNINVIRSI